MKANLFPCFALLFMFAAPLCSEEAAAESQSQIFNQALDQTLEQSIPLAESITDPHHLPDLTQSPPQSHLEYKNDEIAFWGFGRKNENSSPPPSKTEGYTINYKTVSILEYLRFASKICKVNFIYDEADLNFTITVVSDDPITPDNVMATLLQVLRIHGLQLLEQDNSLVIHRAPDVRQVATIVTENGKKSDAPIVTRIFRVKNVKPDSMAAIIRPMVSAGAILEVSAETRQLILTDVTANVDKVATLIENLDSPHSLLEIKSYEVKNNKPEYLITIGTQIMTPIAQGNPFILVPQDLANAIFIVSTPDLVQKALDVFATLDVRPKKGIETERKLKSENIFVYKAVNTSADNVLRGLENIASSLQKSGIPESDLIAAIDSAKPIRETNSIMFVGSKESIDKMKEFLAALDTPSKESLERSFFIFKPQNRSVQEVEKAILEMAGNLKSTGGADESLIRAIDSVKINAATNTLVFSGEEKTFPQIREMLGTIDGTPGKTKFRNSFFLYKIQQAPEAEIESSLKTFAKNLNKSNVPDEGLIETIDSMKYIKETNSILFTGPEPALKRLQDLVPAFDTGIGSAISQKNFYIFTPKYASRERTESYLKQIADSLSKNHEDELVNAIHSMKWIDSSRSFIFHGSENSLARLKELLGNFDTSGASFTVKPGYYLYKVQHTSGEQIEDDLDQIAKDLKSTGVDPKLVEVIHKIRYIKETNSLLLTGDLQAIEEAKKMIADLDYEREQVVERSNFFMYKPKHLQAAQILKSLHDVDLTLKKANLADPILLSAIDSAKYVESTNSIIFTGSSEALQRIQGLVAEIDVPPAMHAPIQHVGKTTFLLYKLKNASGPNIVNSLQAMASNLKKTGTGDKDLLAALNSMKYVKETNSLFFTGTEEALNKVQSLVEQFDVTSLGAAPKIETGGTATNFFVYKPQSLGGPELEKIMTDFAENLKMSGLADPDLFNAINSMRWIDKTQSLVFTGSPKSLDQVKELLKTFDIPSNLPQGTSGGPLEPSIQAIDNTSFLVYKLQFHKGDEIQGALKQIAKDLILSNAPVNQNLLNSINSIQWLEVTNSLLCSGDQETLTRLRELIKNLDIPLKQVYIEMLVIQTSLANALTFGLEWSGNYKYRNKFATVMNNTAPALTGDYAADSLFNSLQNTLTPPTTSSPTVTAPAPQQIPASGSGAFDLGIIGEVIRHNGQTFLTLGSLLQAVQTDDETSVILTPKILTQDGRTSSIFVGNNIPFVGSFVQNTASNATINTSNLEYRDIGLNLTITPVLGNSDIVTLDISLDQSQTIGTITGASINFANQTANGIVTSKNTMTTTVHVPDNNFLVLSGMVNSSDAKIQSAIPCLGGLPIIGAAFSRSNETVANQNLVIFIRPHIINSLEDMREITSKEEEFFRDQTGTPFLEKNFNEAMELIKTVNDE